MRKAGNREPAPAGPDPNLPWLIAFPLRPGFRSVTLIKCSQWKELPASSVLVFPDGPAVLHQPIQLLPGLPRHCSSTSAGPHHALLQIPLIWGLFLPLPLSIVSCLCLLWGFSLLSSCTLTCHDLLGLRLLFRSLRNLHLHPLTWTDFWLSVPTLWMCTRG